MNKKFKRFEFQIPSLHGNDPITSRLSSRSPNNRRFARPLFDTGIHSVTMIHKKRYRKNHHQRTNFHIITLLLKGELKVQLGEKKCKQKTGMISFCPKNENFICESEKPIWCILVNIYDRPIWEPLKKEGSYIRPYESSDYMLLLLNRIFEARQKQSDNDRLNALEDSKSLAELIKREIRTVAEKSKKNTDKLDQLVSKIQFSPEEQWTVAKMAKSVHLSPRSLNRHFHHEYGMGPMDYVISKRLDLALEQLINTEEKIETIASSLNYKSVYSFSNLFLRHMGMRPGEYRSKYSSKK